MCLLQCFKSQLLCSDYARVKIGIPFKPWGNHFCGQKKVNSRSSTKLAMNWNVEKTRKIIFYGGVVLNQIHLNACIICKNIKVST
jgi:hypothetical protein